MQWSGLEINIDGKVNQGLGQEAKHNKIQALFATRKTVLIMIKQYNNALNFQKQQREQLSVQRCTAGEESSKRLSDFLRVVDISVAADEAVDRSG